jgi:hypothetical protein
MKLPPPGLRSNIEVVDLFVVLFSLDPDPLLAFPF